MEKIDHSRLVEMLSDPEVPDSAIRPYLQMEFSESTPFHPSIVANPALVMVPETEAAVAMASLNGIARWRRQQLYKRKIQGWTGTRVVSEGDSWFQYPFLIEDVIDHLFNTWAIYDLSAAGDLLADMARQDEVTAAVISQKPDFLLLSGGGNDVLGGGQLVRYLSRPAPGKAPADYVLPEFAALLKATMASYSDLIGKALKAGVKKVICHTYDYPIPNNGRWLGRPMASIGITDRTLQRDIVRVLIDRFHDALAGLIAGFDDRVVLADCRGVVPDDQWFDELHPTSHGFTKVAVVIAGAATGGPVVVEAVGEAEVAPERPLPVGDAAAVEALLAVETDALVAEIGRRQAILEFSPDAGGTMSLEMPVAGTESFLGDFAELGKRLVDRLHRELFAVLCRDQGVAKEERDRLRNALKLSEAGMIGAISVALMSLGTPPFVAPLVAAVIVKSGINPAWEVTCQFWGEKLGETPDLPAGG